MTDERARSGAEGDAAVSPAEVALLDLLEERNGEALLRRLAEVRADRVVGELAEVAGLLGAALEPAVPRPSLRAELLDALSGDETQHVDVAALAPPAPPRAVAAPLGRPDAPPSRRSRWPLALAAVLALALAGSVVALLRLAERLEGASRTAAALQGRVAELESTVASTREEAARQAATGERLGLVTQVGAAVCPLGPPASGAPMPSARAVLFIGGDHQHWYLKATGLEPQTGDRVYALWFVPEAPGGAPVPGGTFRIAGDEHAELSSAQMPATRAVFVTLEAAPDPQRPQGPVVLYGDAVMRLL